MAFLMEMVEPLKVERIPPKQEIIKVKEEVCDEYAESIESQYFHREETVDKEDIGDWNIHSIHLSGEQMLPKFQDVRIVLEPLLASEIQRLKSDRTVEEVLQQWKYPNQSLEYEDIKPKTEKENSWNITISKEKILIGNILYENNSENIEVIHSSLRIEEFEDKDENDLDNDTMERIINTAGKKCTTKSVNTQKNRNKEKQNLLFKTTTTPTCDICEKTFSRNDNLKLHMRRHTGEKPFKCNICGKMFKTYVSKDHMRVHTAERPYKCDVCGKSFPRKSTRNDHLRTHSSEKPFKCTICGKCFRYNGNLKVHLRIHTGEKSFKCDTCEKRFINNDHLKRHLLFHTGEKRFKCDTCGDKFPLKDTLKRHMMIHAIEKPFKCDICGQRFIKKSYLKAHIHDKLFKCDICSKRFSTNLYLKKHMRIHTEVKPFQCVTCGVCFRYRNVLMRHERVHTGEKPYECSICGRCFVDSGDRHKHMKTHSGEKPFKCDRCGRRFAVKRYLKIHMRIHYSEELM